MTPAGIKPATFQFVAQHLNHWVTAVPTLYLTYCMKINDFKVTLWLPAVSIQDPYLHSRCLKKVNLFLCTPLGEMVGRDSGLLSLHRGTTWRRLTCFMIRPPYHRGNCPHYRLNRRICVLQCQYELSTTEKIYPWREMNVLFFGYPEFR